MTYTQALAGGIVIRSTAPEHAERLEALQDRVFPTLSPDERFRAPHYLKHLELFPEGQFVALAGDRVVGATSTIRLDFDFDHVDHTFADILQGGWLTSHDPDGAWLYGADVGVSPDYRRRGIARALYAARHHTVRALGLRGQVTVGMMNGYGAVRDHLTPERYYERLLAGDVTDPTLTAQVRVGFEPRALVRDYLHDPACGNCGVLIVLDASKDIA